MTQSRRHLRAIQADLDEPKFRPVLDIVQLQSLIDRFPKDHELLRNDCYARLANALGDYVSPPNKIQQSIDWLRDLGERVVTVGRATNPENPTWFDVQQLSSALFDELFVERFLPEGASLKSIREHLSNDRVEITVGLMVEKLVLTREIHDKLQDMIEIGMTIELDNR